MSRESQRFTDQEMWWKKEVMERETKRVRRRRERERGKEGEGENTSSLE